MHIEFDGTPDQIREEIRQMFGTLSGDSLMFEDFLTVIGWLRQGNKIEAVKFLRQKVSIGLLEAKQFCDKLGRF